MAFRSCVLDRLDEMPVAVSGRQLGYLHLELGWGSHWLRDGVCRCKIGKDHPKRGGREEKRVQDRALRH